MTPDQIATKADIAALADRFARKPLVFKATPAWPLPRTKQKQTMTVGEA